MSTSTITLDKNNIHKNEWKSLDVSNRNLVSSEITAKSKISKKPKWIRVKLPTGKKYTELRGLVTSRLFHSFL